MNNKARTQVTIGEIVNLMSVDTEHVEDISGYVSAIWASPLEIIISLVLLYSVVGVAMVAGLAVIVVHSLTNAFMTRKFKVLRKSKMKVKDERIKLMTELLNGIKVDSFLYCMP